MASLIISYVPNDVGSVVDNLDSLLRQRFGQHKIYKGVGQVISPGDDFVTAIQEAVQQSEGILLVIGDAWHGAWVNDPNDYNHLALSAALSQNKRIIPVLVNGATLPDGLPAPLDALKRRMGIPLNETTANQDMGQLYENLQKFLTGPAVTPPPTPPPAPVTPAYQTPPPMPGYQAPPQSGYAPQGNYYGGQAQPMTGAPASESSLQKLVGAGVVLVAVGAMIAFFALPWASYEDDRMEESVKDFILDSSYAEDELGVNTSTEASQGARNFINTYLADADGCTYTGFHVVTDGEGSDECPKAEDAETSIEKPGTMRFLEMSVALMPIIAFAVLVLGIKASQAGASSSVFRNIVILGILMAIFPYVWEVLYQPTYEPYLEDVLLENTDFDDFSDLGTQEREGAEFTRDLFMAVLSSVYQSLTNALPGIAIVVLAIAGLAFGNKNTLYPPNPQYPPANYRQY